jgi:hypothetical protein
MLVPAVIALLLAQAPQEPKLATLEGVVTHAATKTPVRKAKVTLTPTGSESPAASVETADDGKFVLKDVKPGRYRLSASKAGHEATAYGARKPGEGIGQVLRVDAGAEITGLAIAMPKQGVIAGKVLDADNEPVGKALVMALADMYVNGKRVRLPRGTIPVLANDLGEYRIGELPPGKYIVCAMPFNWVQPQPPQADSKPASEEGNATTCFPSAPRMAESTQLEIRDGSEIPGIDVRMIRSKMVSVQGHVAGVPAGASAMTILNLTTKGFGPMGNAMHPRSLVMSSDGKFEFRQVPPGSYIIHSLPTGLGNAPYVVKSSVEIGDQPVTDLTVPALVPFELKARVNAEPGPTLKLPSIRVILTAADEISSALAMGTANADGDLAIANTVPGRHKVNIGGLPQTHHVSEIRLGEQIVEGDEVEIVNAAAPLTISLAIGRGEISGAVRNDKGETVPGATVALVPDPKRPFRYRIARTDQNGVYRLPNLARGEYLLIALDSVEAGALEDEEFFKPLKPKARRVKVEEGGAQNFDLTLARVPES